MAKIGTWSTTAGNNNATPPDGWPEGQAPSTVNDCAREMMASIRTYIANAEYIDYANTPSFLTATTFSMGAADTFNFEVGRRVKLFDATTLYGTINSVSGTFVSVKLDSGALTSSLSSIAMGVVRATNNSLPETIYNNVAINMNGQMDVWQRANSFSAVAGDTVLADRYTIRLGGGIVNVERSERSAGASNVPAINVCGQLLTSAMKLSVNTACALSNSAYALVQTVIEGYDWRQIAHKPQMLQFNVNTNRSGVYSVALRSMSFSAVYVQNYTVSTVNTWQHFNIPIPEAPTDANWNYSSNVGIRLTFNFASGVDFQMTAGAWTTASGSKFGSIEQTNFLSSAGNTFAIAGIKLAEGVHPTPLDFQPYREVLRASKRFWQFLPDGFTAGEVLATGQCIDSSHASFVIRLPVPMRVEPSVSLPAPSAFRVTQIDGTLISVSAVSVTKKTPNSLYISIATVGNIGLTAGAATQLSLLSGEPTALIYLDAEFL